MNCHQLKKGLTYDEIFVFYNGYKFLTVNFLKFLANQFIEEGDDEPKLCRANAKYVLINFFALYRFHSEL